MSAQFEPIAMMAQELSKLPGVGPKTAQRLAYHLASQPLENVRALSVALWEGRKAIRFCETCGNYATGDACPICADPARHNGQPVSVWYTLPVSFKNKKKQDDVNTLFEY